MPISRLLLGTGPTRLLRRRRAALRIVVACGAGWILPLSLNCSTTGNRTIRAANAAEDRGEAHVAYDAYCQALRQDPGDRRSASAIQRLAPTAATYWESQARISESKGDHAEAWRRGMKALDIRPDQPGLADFVRQLEQTYPNDVEPARQAWIRSGQVRVAAATAIESPAVRESTPPEEPVPDSDEAGGGKFERSRSEPERRGARQGRRDQSHEDRRTSARDDQRDAAERPRGSSAETGEFVAVYTLSRRRDSNPERQRIADGIFLRLRDVDDDRSVDIDLDDGNDRIQKIRGMGQGQSKLFRGRSGRWYRFTLIDVDARERTIRVGLRPG
ncbi:MAG: hypothetical protein KF841_04710 [Phycisphaerae bacterium]|nr:hypothetical protein [Phycisphaerae bacterium]